MKPACDMWGGAGSVTVAGAMGGGGEGAREGVVDVTKTDEHMFMSRRAENT